MNLLLDHGSKVNLQTVMGETALMKVWSCHVMRTHAFCKVEISCTETAQLISAFDLLHRLLKIEISLYFKGIPIIWILIGNYMYVKYFHIWLFD